MTRRPEFVGPNRLQGEARMTLQEMIRATCDVIHLFITASNTCAFTDASDQLGACNLLVFKSVEHPVVVDQPN